MPRVKWMPKDARQMRYLGCQDCLWPADWVRPPIISINGPFSLLKNHLCQSPLQRVAEVSNRRHGDPQQSGRTEGPCAAQIECEKKCTFAL